GAEISIEGDTAGAGVEGEVVVFAALAIDGCGGSEENTAPCAGQRGILVQRHCASVGLAAAAGNTGRVDLRRPTDIERAQARDRVVKLPVRNRARTCRANCQAMPAAGEGRTKRQQLP